MYLLLYVMLFQMWQDIIPFGNWMDYEGEGLKWEGLMTSAEKEGRFTGRAGYYISMKNYKNTFSLSYNKTRTRTKFSFYVDFNKCYCS